MNVYMLPTPSPHPYKIRVTKTIYDNDIHLQNYATLMTIKYM